MAKHKKDRNNKNHPEQLDIDKEYLEMHKGKTNEMLPDDLEEDGNIIVEMTDEEGNVYLYEEEMIIPVDDKKFALLVAIPSEEEEGHHHEHDCDCGCGEDDVIIAKIVENEDGEEEYVEPTDEEFEIVRQAYEEFFSEESLEEQARE